MKPGVRGLAGPVVVMIVPPSHARGVRDYS
jgi:hypothetical protein